MEHWVDPLNEFLKDELSDVEKYAEIAKQHTGEVKQIFHDMAKEEYEHACAIWHLMEHKGMTDGLDKHEIFRAAKEAL